MSLSFHGTEIWDSFEARMILLRQFRSQFTCAELMFYIEIWGSVRMLCADLTFRRIGQQIL